MMATPQRTGPVPGAATWRDRGFQRGNRAVAIVVAVGVMTVILGLVGETQLSGDRMAVIWPALVSSGIFVAFSLILSEHRGIRVCGEVGFIYLAIAQAYTVLPAIKLVILDFNLPPTFDGVGFAALQPTPESLGRHYWRLVLFTLGVAIGFLVVRMRPLPEQTTRPAQYPAHGFGLVVISLLVGCSLAIEAYFSQGYSAYIDYYTRFDHLSESVRRLINVGLILKTGGYLILLVLLFNRYRQHRIAIVTVTAALCVFEVARSLGSRIEAFSILLAVFGLYHHQVRPIGVKKGAMLLVSLALVFSAVGLVRAADYDLGAAFYGAFEQKTIQGSEFDAVLASSYHIYEERAQGTLAPRDWRMFFWEFIAIVPFVDHTTYQPMYWYARNYFPRAVVPPTTMGVAAESGLWGGELDLLVRSLVNGALFAWLTRWFLRRRDRWWAVTIYIFCYANCVMTLKYSVLYLIVPLTKAILPTILLAAGLLRLQTRRTTKGMPCASA